MFQDHFGPQAAQYARFRPRYPGELYELLLDAVRHREHAWDCGTGNGQVAVELGNWFARVTASDGSAAQIEHALPHPKVSYCVARAEQSGLDEKSVDLLTCATAVHWFALEDFYREVRRVVRPGGLLAVWTYSPRVEGVLREPLRHLSEEVLREDWPPGYQLAYDGYRDLPFPFAELPTPPLVIELQWERSQIMGWVDSWSGLRRYRERTGHDPLPDWGARLPEGPIALPMPLAVRLGRVSAA